MEGSLDYSGLGVGDIIEKKLSTADISEFFKLSANYRYRIDILQYYNTTKNASAERFCEKVLKELWWRDD